jgi:DNA-binding beta-propeller fold protein YncE
MKQFLAVAFLLAAAAALLSQPEGPVRPGPQPDGSSLLVSGARLTPAGRQIPLETMPMASLLSPDGQYLVVMQAGYLPPKVSTLNAKTLEPVDSLPVPDAWLGMAFAPGSGLLYVSGGSRAEVYEIALNGMGKLQLRRTFPLVPANARKHTDFLGDLTISSDGRLLYVAGLYRDSVFAVNTQTGIVVEEWPSAHRPYKLLLHPDGKWLYVSGWGDGFLYRHNTVDGAKVSRLLLGPQPMDMVWRGKETVVEGEAEEGEKSAAAPYKARIFAAVSNTNTVASVAVNEDGSLRLLERINVALYPEQPVGMTPSSLALSSDLNTLYVVCSDANAVAVAGVASARTRVKGFVPAGWYPTFAHPLPANRLLILNGRGARSFPNPQGPNPSRRPAPTHEGNIAVQYVGRLQLGSASLVEAFDDQKLDEYTAQVLRNTPYKTRLLADAGTPQGSVIPASAGARGPIRHVIYIVKENRTYDQVLGDLGIGNGDASLTLFGEEVTPNQHKLARDFVLLDNFYVNADVSADGHNWSAAAIAPAYVQRMWPNSYSARRRHYDYEGGERAALPPAGYIWSNALAAGRTVRNYGWWAANVMPRPASGRQIAQVRDPALAPHTNLNYRAYDLDFPDVERIQPFLEDLRQWESSGAMPEFIVLRIGNDHTSGTAPGKHTPRAAVADNDAAMGLLVEAVSKSRFWPATAIFVLEDDAQNGPDHVDSHRSPAFVISPYTRGRGIDSTMYNTVSMLRTMELILGMRPMTMHDAGATPMWRAFRNQPDPRPWQAEKPRIPLDEKNPPNNPTAARTLRMDFTEADRIDDNELNEILWLAVKGTEPPVPMRSLFGR